MNHRLRSMVIFVPALGVVGIAVLYATGAIVKAGQLRGAKLSVRDTLPLVPLQQILALGIGSLVGSIGWFLSLAVVAWCYLWFFYKRGHDKIEPITVGPRAVRWWRLAAIVTGALLVILNGYEFYVLPFFSAVALCAALDLSLYAGQTHRGRRYVAKTLAVYFVILLAARVGQAYLSPDALPVARVTSSSALTLTGSLIATDGGTWYVKIGKGRFEAFPASRVNSVVVTSEKAHTPRPVLKVVWAHIKPW